MIGIINFKIIIFQEHMEQLTKGVLDVKIYPPKQDIPRFVSLRDFIIVTIWIPNTWILDSSEYRTVWMSGIQLVRSKVRHDNWMNPFATISRRSWHYNDVLNQRFRGGRWRWWWRSNVRNGFLPLLAKLFIIPRHPVAISVTVFYNLTKWTNYLFIFPVKI